MGRERNQPLELAGKRALVMGLGTRQGGVGVTRYLVSQGADVTVTDLRDAETLQSSIRAIGGLPVRYRLGEHREEDFDSADLIVRNPGVPLSSPWLQRARRNGIPIEMEMSLFFRACPAPIIGITGTKGKTTTATICAGILARHRPETVLAGNMGTSALAQLDRIQAETPVVLELSSWQLEGLADYEMSPHIAVLTNISEDHLNRYDSLGDYIEAKRHITRFQRPDDWFVVNRNDNACWDSRAVSDATVVPFGVLDGNEDGAGLDDETLYWRWTGERTDLIESAELPISGRHVIANALAASAAAILAGAPVEDVRSGLRDAEAIPHRQELVAVVDGIAFVNDTTATAPAAAIAALETFQDRPIVLIAGGSGKRTRLDEFADVATRMTTGIVLLDGEETPRLRQLLVDAGAPNVSEPVDSMSEAVRLAREWVLADGVVLLSPACASFGMFQDEFDRGEQFRDAVSRLRPGQYGGTA